MKKILKKDIVIKAGTVFKCIDGRTTEYVQGNYAHIIGLSKDSYGEMIYSMDVNDPDLDEWFEEPEE